MGDAPMSALGGMSNLRSRAGMARLGAVCVAALLAAGYGVHVFLAGTTLSLEVRLLARERASSQLFIDVGRGINEADSVSARLEASAVPQSYYYRLSQQPVRALRFDPLDGPGRVEIERLRIVDARGHTVRLLALGALRPAGPDVSLRIVGEVASVDATGGDPRLEVGLATPIEPAGAAGVALAHAAAAFAGLLGAGLLARRLVRRPALAPTWQRVRLPLQRAVLVVVALGFVFALGEGLLRLVEPRTGEPAGEEAAAPRAGRLLDYPDTWRAGGLGPGGYLQEGFAAYVNDGYGGRAWWHNNSQGFRNTREFGREPPPGVLRILSLGDSFTAGYRVGQDETFSARLEAWANQQLGPTEVMVSCIESPATGFTYLEQSGLAWNPHLVLLGITLGNDLAQDYIARDPAVGGFRDGLDRYDLPDRNWAGPPESPLAAGPPGIDWPALLTGGSRLYVRLARWLPQGGSAPVAWYGATERPKLFDAMHGLGFFIEPPPPPIVAAQARHFEVLRDFQRVLAARGIVLVVALFPQRFQVQSADWAATVAAYGLREQTFDRMRPNRAILAACTEAGVVCIDPTPAMATSHKQTATPYYFPRGDMHWNPAGHQAWLEAVLPALEPHLRSAHPGR